MFLPNIGGPNEKTPIHRNTNIHGTIWCTYTGWQYHNRRQQNPAPDPTPNDNKNSAGLLHDLLRSSTDTRSKDPASYARFPPRKRGGGVVTCLAIGSMLPLHSGLPFHFQWCLDKRTFRLLFLFCSSCGVQCKDVCISLALKRILLTGQMRYNPVINLCAVLWHHFDYL